MKSLRKWMTKHNVTQQGLADRIGYSQSTVSQVLNGSRQPSVDLVWVLAKVTRIKPGVLVNETRRLTR